MLAKEAVALACAAFVDARLQELVERIDMRRRNIGIGRQIGERIKRG